MARSMRLLPSQPLDRELVGFGMTPPSHVFLFTPCKVSLFPFPFSTFPSLCGNPTVSTVFSFSASVFLQLIWSNPCEVHFFFLAFSLVFVLRAWQSMAIFFFWLLFFSLFSPPPPHLSFRQGEAYPTLYKFFFSPGFFFQSFLR